MSSLVSLAALLGPAACGNSSTNGKENASDAATDSRGTSSDAGEPIGTEAGASDSSLGALMEASDAPVEAADAPVEAADFATCRGLVPAALAQFRTVVDQNVSCSQDTDCLWAYGSGDPGPDLGACVNACGVVASQAGLAAVQAGAAQACQAYNADGCPDSFSLSCADAGSPVCCGGFCISNLFYVGSSTATYPLTHGVCETFNISFAQAAPYDYGLEPEAPGNLPVPVTAISNATLYSDPNCTTPLTNQAITIPTGASQGTFSLLPTSAGTASFTVYQLNEQYPVQ
jgi:hypothetical protein